MSVTVMTPTATNRVAFDTPGDFTNQGTHSGGASSGTIACANFNSWSCFSEMTDSGVIPSTATIDSVLYEITLQGNVGLSVLGNNLFAYQGTLATALLGVGPASIWDGSEDPNFGDDLPHVKGGYIATAPDGSAWTQLKLLGSATIFGQFSGAGGPMQTILYSNIKVTVTWTAVVLFSWYFNPLTDQYQYSDSDPGNPWILRDPVISVDSSVPVNGATVGGTLITIVGTGFGGIGAGNDATVTIGGIAATNVVIVNSRTITALIPEHALGPVNIVVTNPDGATATLSGAFTYNTYVDPSSTSSGSWWGLQRLDMKIRREERA